MTRHDDPHEYDQDDERRPPQDDALRLALAEAEMRAYRDLVAAQPTMASIPTVRAELVSPATPKAKAE